MESARMDAKALLDEYQDLHKPERWQLAERILEQVDIHAITREQRYKLMMDIAVNPATPSSVIEILAVKATGPILVRIAEHVNASPEILAQLAYHKSADVRCAVASNKNTDGKTLSELIKDEDPTVRYTMAESYHVPTSLLEQLFSDENPYVAARASQTLKRMRDDERRRNNPNPIVQSLSVVSDEDDDFSCTLAG